MFFDYPGESTLMQSYGKRGDFIYLGNIALGGSCPESSTAQAIKSEFPKMFVIQGFVSIPDIQRCAGTFSSSIDYVGYDYEPGPGYSP